MSSKKVEETNIGSLRRRIILKKSLLTLPLLPLFFDSKFTEASVNDLDNSGSTNKVNDNHVKKNNVNVTDEIREQEFERNISFAEKVVSSVEELRKVEPNTPGQRIILESWHPAEVEGLKLQVGGGRLYSVFNDELIDDGGTIFRVNSKWCWVRDSSNEIDAQWFGVTSDDVPRENNISSAIDYITKNGGVLTFPRGKVNFGKLRKRVEYFDGIKSFEIKGQGNTTIFTFENIDPPPRKSNQNWVSEKPLLLIKGKDTENYIDSPVLKDFTIDYSRQRNRGGTDLSSIEECHPTPHSTGCIAIYAIFCRKPIFEGLRFQNIYGSGIYCKKSFFPRCSNLEFYDVSANQIIDRQGRMDKDSSGGAIFYWSCYGGLISECTAWNNREYTVDFHSPDNRQQLKSTLCGYIGFWSEFSVSRTDRIDHAPPQIEWMNIQIKNKDLDRVSRGVEIRNCCVYGYVIGIKGEAAVDILISNNMVLNCYLPIVCSGVRGNIEKNFTDMLDCENIKSPQGGLEERRSHLGSFSYTGESLSNQNIVISENYVRTTKYPAFITSRLNLKFKNNYVCIQGTAPIFKTVSRGSFHGLEVDGNTFILEEGAKPDISKLLFHESPIFSNNTFTNKSNNVLEMLFSSKTASSSMIFEKNYIEGAVSLRFFSKTIISRNNFLISPDYNENIVSILGDESNITENSFVINSSQNKGSMSINAKNTSVKKNKINLRDNGKNNAPGVFWIGPKALMPNMTGNVLEGNKQNLSLIYAAVLIMPTLESNFSDGNASLIWVYKKLFGPIDIKINYFNGGYIKSSSDLKEPNSIQNLWDGYEPSIGDRYFYLLPEAGGREGIVMTTSGWREFGMVLI